MSRPGRIFVHCVAKTQNKGVFAKFTDDKGKGESKIIRNIDRMYYEFGYARGGYCHQCPHFGKKCWNKKRSKKVVGYDETGKEIVEYESFLACGLIDKPFPENNGVIEGQLTIKEIIEGRINE